MGTEFLRSVAKAFVNGGNLDSVYVLPNRRSIKFFQKYLGLHWGELYGKPLISPKIITINDFIEELSGLKQADPIEQLYILYKVYIKAKYKDISFEQASGKESFDEFVGWGNFILKDFNDVDKYLVDPKRLFTNIKDLKDIEDMFSYLNPAQLDAVRLFWTNFLKGGKFSQKKEFFNSIWSIMFEIYTNYKEELKAKGLCFEGQMYRDAAENIEKKDFDREIVFIGFNAPNRCELKIMSHLKSIGKGDFYWDFYGKLLTDKENGASEIISDLAKRYTSRYVIEDSTVNPAEQNITAIGVPSGVGQSFVVSKILNELFPQESVSPMDTFHTAVIIPDESLLLPVLNSIPHKFDSLNVTMGYPIAATSFFSFVKHVVSLQKEAKNREGKWNFYYKTIIELLSHEYVKKLSGSRVNEVRDAIINENRIYIEENDPLLHGDELFDALFKVAVTTDDVIGYQLGLLKMLDESLPLWDREFIYQYYVQINRLKELSIPMEVKTYYSLIQKLTSGISVPFTGEPLKGLQIMGPLETRLLDFDNVIIVSANEGKFPLNTAEHSLIPYNLRYGFGLPTYELVDGIASYHFYRSICRAKNVYLVYDTRTDGLNTGEVSRYVKQLKYHFNLNVNEKVALSDIDVSDGIDTAIVKTDEVIGQLRSKYIGGNKNLSASAINNYLTCPLKFYFENVEGLKEEEEVMESVESNTFGSIFHSVMENIYLKYRNEVVSKEIVHKELGDHKNLDALIEKFFKEETNIKEIKGQNIIIKELLKKYVNLTLGYDASVAPFIYTDGERMVKYKLPINGGIDKVNFIAFIDRLDKLCRKDGDITRVIDYKTGSISDLPDKYEIHQLFDGSLKKDCKAYIQLYLYALMMYDSKLLSGDKLEKISIVIYLIKKMSDSKTVELNLESENLQVFKEELVKCVEEIFNKDIPFVQKPGDHCKWCPLNVICGM